ncbi:shTK domain protein [Ostertagia ostertagi]
MSSAQRTLICSSTLYVPCSFSTPSQLRHKSVLHVWIREENRSASDHTTLANAAVQTSSLLRKCTAPRHVPCVDQGGESFCLGPYHAGQCSSPDFQPIAQMYCAKTCGICH